MVVVISFGYALVISKVLLRVLKNESDFRCAENAEFTDYEY